MLRTRRRLLLVPLFGLVAFALSWCAFWFYARWQAEQNLEAWLSAEKQDGRIWACADRLFDGFPFQVGLTCTTPTFKEAENPGFEGRLGALRAEASLGARVPSATVKIDLTGPLEITQGAGQPTLVVSWSNAAVTLDGVGPDVVDNGWIEASGVSIRPAGMAAITMDRGRIGLKASAPADPSRVDLTLDVTGLQDPELNRLGGSADPITFAGAATIDHPPAWGAALPTLLEDWRAAGGTIDLTRLALTKGGFGVTGTGRFHLDAFHRVEGRFDGQFRGLEPIAARFGIPVGAVKLGGLLSNLLGGHKPAGETAELALPLIARDGRLFVGPAKTAIGLPPLY